MNTPWREVLEQIGPVPAQLVTLLEAGERETIRLRHELAETTSAARAADLATPLAHECNNFLNVVLLQVAVLELEVQEAQRPLLEDIRRQAAAFKAVVHEFQSQRPRAQPVLQLVEVSGAVRDAIVEMNALPASPFHFLLREDPAKAMDSRIPDTRSPILVDASLPPDLPPIQSSAAELKRLIALLLTGLAGAAQGSVLAVRLESAPGSVTLHFRTANPAPAPTRPPRAAPVAGPEQMGQLVWGASQALARRLQGKLFEDKQEEGPLVLVLQFETNTTHSDDSARRA